jgi:hypothetical protein
MSDPGPGAEGHEIVQPEQMSDHRAEGDKEGGEDTPNGDAPVQRYRPGRTGEELRPWQFKPGQSGNPGGKPKTRWKVHLLAAYKRHGSRMWDVLGRIAAGQQIQIIGVDGQPLVDSEGKPRVLTPKVSDVLAASKELLDRAIGKAPALIALLDENSMRAADDQGEERSIGPAVIAPSDLSAEELAVLRRIAQKRALGLHLTRKPASTIGAQDGGQPAVTIDVPVEPIDEPGQQREPSQVDGQQQQAGAGQEERAVVQEGESRSVQPAPPQAARAEPAEAEPARGAATPGMGRYVRPVRQQDALVAQDEAASRAAGRAGTDR